VESGVDVREEIFRLAIDRRWTVRELTQRRATLEDVFVELTHPDEVV
jgi:ABC-2 type transport system ATP-binding protein